MIYARSKPSFILNKNKQIYEFSESIDSKLINRVLPASGVDVQSYAINKIYKSLDFIILLDLIMYTNSRKLLINARHVYLHIFIWGLNM